MNIVISIIVMILWIAMIQTQKYWLGTKIGDVFVLIIAISSVYGAITAVDHFVEWILK